MASLCFIARRTIILGSYMHIHSATKITLSYLLFHYYCFMKNVCTNCRLADIYKSKNLDKKELNISDRVLLAVAFEAHFFCCLSFSCVALLCVAKSKIYGQRIWNIKNILDVKMECCILQTLIKTCCKMEPNANETMKWRNIAEKGFL